MASQPPPISLPPAEEIRHAAREVVGRAHYQLDSPDRAESSPFWMEALRWVLKPFFWLFDSLDGLPDFLRWFIVIALGIVCVALIVHIVYSFLMAIRPTASRPGKYQSAGNRQVDPAILEGEAAVVADRGDHIGAIRILFRAGVLRIEESQQKRFQPGFTNRELLRRFRSSPICEPLNWFVDTIDLKWYGDQPCTEADFRACQHEYARITGFLQEPIDALPA